MKKLFGRTVVYCLITLIVLILIFPFLVAITTAFKGLEEVYSTPPHWLPKRLAWENFKYVWEMYPLAAYFRNSFLVATGSTLLTTVLAVPAAYAFARLSFPGRKPLLFILLIVQMFSPVIVVIALFKVVKFFHLFNSLWSLIMVNTVFTLAFSIWMMNGYFNTIPKELEEAALIDGCSRVQSMLRITLPVAMPGVATIIIYAFIVAWNEFMFALTFINDTDKRTLTLGLYNFVGRWTVSWHHLMAASLLSIIPIIILFMFIEKQLVQGLASGAVKG